MSTIIAHAWRQPLLVGLHPDKATSSVTTLGPNLVARFLDARRTCTPEYFEKRLFASLNAVPRSHSTTTAHGLVRDFDSEIVAEVISRLRDVPERPLQILEVGAGVSIGDHNSFVGSPWLSRWIKHAFGKMVSVTVSDFSSSTRTYAVANGELFCASTPGIESPPTSKLAAKDLGLFSIDATPLHTLSPGLYKSVSTLLQNRYNLSDVASARVFFRPALDPGIEQAVFGLDVAPEVNHSELGKSFPDQKFDFIFGRYLYQPANGAADIQSFQLSARDVLSAGGACFAQFDVARLGIDYDRFLQGQRRSTQGDAQWIADIIRYSNL